MRRLRELGQRLRRIATRATLTRSTESTRLRSLQARGLAEEVSDDVEHFQQYGFTSRPQAGAELIVLSPGGSKSAAIVIACEDRRFRLATLEEGEVALYTDEGDRIHFRRNGEIEVIAATRVRINAPLVRIEGDLEVTGEVLDRCESDGHTMDEMRTVFDAHTHTENGKGNQTAPPSTPIG